jgi:hypothetical protein
MVTDRKVWPDTRIGAKGQRPPQGRAGAGVLRRKIFEERTGKTSCKPVEPEDNQKTKKVAFL